MMETVWATVIGTLVGMCASVPLSLIVFALVRRVERSERAQRQG